MTYSMRPSRIPVSASLALTEREEKVVELVASGMKNLEIAAEIGTSEHMVKNYLRLIYDKLGMSNRVELAMWHVAHEEGNR